ncbi:hypothetical protein M2480_001404 [Parabacteroides sp. PFB2-12]|uniref:outer membrane beta-barrel protein n=1 Tax=unclassified Parabacteroides TaxID=2649774 RepID=UPI002473AECE|nr:MULTISPECIES: outer membrane beta-barrel protein [unclassified Parabacteroides]MDH6343056.1 hypothetical protein [Parabacteroides sp. PM6-13]MDH6390431.1 hypothetical protein [Parabacteroides sp. PFB2-12]
MKKLFLIMAVAIPFGLSATGVVSPDTTLFIEGKKIEIRENEERMKVRVYDRTGQGNYVEDELVFEGHYKDGQSYERRKQAKAITIPLPGWRYYGMDPHWAGINLGFANFADGDLHVNDISGVSLRSNKSWELNINFFEYDLRLSRRYRWALVTGVGIRWNRYRLDENKHFKRLDGKTILEIAPEGVRYTKSRLNTTSLTIPLLLEWQPVRRHSDFFISAGAVGVINTAATSRVEYRNENDKKVKQKVDDGLYIKPITVDFLFQMGFDWIGIYLKYSPMELFENKKGPALHPVSAGIQFHI